MALESTALVAYNVHAILLNISLRKRQWLTVNGTTLVGILPVCCSEYEVAEHRGVEAKNSLFYKLTLSTIVPLEVCVYATRYIERTERLVNVLHEAMKVVSRTA